LAAMQEYSLPHILDELSMKIWKQQIELVREGSGLPAGLE
jgi:hypothetical protein